MLRALMNKVDRHCKQRDDVLRKNQKEMLEIKNTITEMKNVFIRPISKLDMAEERISELEGISIEFSKMETQGEKKD